MFSISAFRSNIPRIQKFCFCMDVVDGVRYVVLVSYALTFDLFSSGMLVSASF